MRPTHEGAPPTRRARRWIARALAVVTLALVVAALNLERIVLAVMTPGVPYSAEPPPRAPDYDRPEAWSERPDGPAFARFAPVGSPAVAPEAARAAVFYVHPTSYVGARWNGPVDDPTLNAATDLVATRIQANAFNACCVVWAPRYRQANGTSFLTPTPDGARAQQLAYDDVRRAFRHFIAHAPPTTPFFVVAHSQGALFAERLLRDEVHGTPLRERLVAAYLVGGTVTVEGLRAQMPDLAPCREPDSVHCVAAWNARSPGFTPTRVDLYRADRRPLLCVNPLTWRDDGAPAPARANLGAVFLETDDWRPMPGFADAQCVDGTLVVRTLGDAPRDLKSRILDRALGAGNHHAIEFQMYFMNLRENAARRLAAMPAP